MKFMQDTRLISAVMAACQATAAAGELGAAVAEDGSKRLEPRLLALALSSLKGGNYVLSTTAAAAGEGVVGGAGRSSHSSSATCLAVFHIGSVAGSLAKDLLIHGHNQQQQQQPQESVPAAAIINSSSSNSQQTVEPGNWLMLIGRGFLTAGCALEQCCTHAAAAAAADAAAAASTSLFALQLHEAARTAAPWLDNLLHTEWITDSEHPLRAMRHMSAVAAWLGQLGLMTCLLPHLKQSFTSHQYCRQCMQSTARVRGASCCSCHGS
jgi:hypothetical protein